MTNDLATEKPKPKPKQLLAPKREKFSHSNGRRKSKSKAKGEEDGLRWFRAESYKNLHIPSHKQKSPYHILQTNQNLQPPLVPKSPR